MPEREPDSQSAEHFEGLGVALLYQLVAVQATDEREACPPTPVATPPSKMN